MTKESTKRKLSAVLSADVKVYSRLMGRDEAGTVRRLKEYRASMTDLIRHYGGRVVDSPGDNLLAEFASAVDATECAVAIQEKLEKKNSELSDEQKMAFRIGINLGDVIEDEGRLYGDGINIAARIESLAEAGGICISEPFSTRSKTNSNWDSRISENSRPKTLRSPLGFHRPLTDKSATRRKTDSAAPPPSTTSEGL